ELSLSIGVALTGDQVAALTHDIVWMETTVVNGVEVLAPVLYLAQLKETNIASNGSIIAGSDVSIETDGLQNTDSIYAYNQLDVTTKDIVNRGMLAAADTLNLNADELVNLGTITSDNVANINVDSLLNQSLINADGSLDIKAFGDILNDGADITGGDITLTSTDGDVINQTRGSGLNTRQGNISGTGTVTLDALSNVKNIGSTINGNNVVLNTTNGNIDLITQSQTHTSKDGNNISTSIGQTASINAVNNVTFNSGNDVNITAANVNAGGSISLNADKDINVGVIQDHTRRENKEKRNHTISETITNVTSSLNAGGNLLANAGNDITLTGVQAKAGQSVQLIGKGDVTITSVNDTQYDYDKTVKKKSFGRKKTTITESAQQTVVNASIDAGASVFVQAGDNQGIVTHGGDSNVTLTGVDINAKENITVVADNDVTIQGAQYLEFDKKHTKKSGLGGFSKKEKFDATKDSKIQSANLATQSGDITVVSGNDVNLISADVNAGKDANIKAENNVLIAAGTVTKETESWEKSSGFLSGGNLYAMEKNSSGTIDKSAQSTNVIGKGNVNIHGGTAQVIGSNVISETQGAGGVNITTDVGSAEILAAEQSTESYSNTEKLTIGLGDVVKKLTDVKDLVDTKDGVLTINIAKAQYDKVDESNKTVTHLASNVQSNSNVTIDSAEDIVVEGSNVVADADSDGKGDVNLTANDSIIIKEAVASSETQKDEMHGTAEISVVVQNEYAEAAKAVLAVEDAKDQLKEAERALRRHNKQKDSLKATLATLEQQLADGVPGVSQQDIDFLSLQIGDLESDDKWHQASIALAATNLASKVTGAAQQAATAASSTGTYGFNAGLQLDLNVEKSQSSESTTTSQASFIGGNNVNLDAGNQQGNSIDISGSHIIANDSLNAGAYDVNITASKDTADKQTTSENLSATAKVTVYGMSGGASVNGSLNRSQSNDSSVKNNNSTLTADNININTTNDLTVAGGNVDANKALNVNVGNDLVVASVQNTANGSNKSMGISGGVSFGGTGRDKKHNKDANGNLKTISHSKGTNDIGNASGGNGGINVANGRYRSQETVLSTLTSTGTADINVGGNTHIAGAVIATTDKEGNDTGKLNLNTKTITFDNLLDVSTSSSNSVNASVNVSLADKTSDANNAGTDNSQSNAVNPINKSETATGKTLNPNSSSLTVNNASNTTMGRTLATLGNGNITVGGESNPEIAGLNRDVGAVDKALFTASSEIKVDASIDHRLFTKDGREAIANDVKDVKEFGEDIATVVSKINEDSKFTTTDFFNELENKQITTALRNNLLENHSELLTALDQGTDDEKIAAQKQIVAMALNDYGLDLTAVNFFDGDNVTSGVLSDSALGDVKAVTVLDGEHQGTMGLDVTDGDSTSEMINSLGQEVVEVETLQTGQENDANQEASSQAFGEYLSQDIEKARMENGTFSDGSAFSADIANNAAVQLGNEWADQVGNASVDHRQLFFAEAKAIVEHAAEYAKQHGITEHQAKVELTQQALLQVDKTWSEQKHITENSRAREFLTDLSSKIGEVEESNTNSNNIFDLITGLETSVAFVAKDKETFEDTYINAQEVGNIEVLLGDGNGFLTQYATENGEKTTSVMAGETTSRAVEKNKESIENAIEAISENPKETAVQLWDSAVKGLKDISENPEQLITNDTRGTAYDRMFIAELQGNHEEAIEQSVDDLMETLSPPGVGKAAKGTVGEAVEVIAKKNEKPAGKGGDEQSSGDTQEGDTTQQSTEQSNALTPIDKNTESISSTEQSNLVPESTKLDSTDSGLKSSDYVSLSREELRQKLDLLPDGQGANYSIFKLEDGSFVPVRKTDSNAGQIKVNQDDKTLYSALNDRRDGPITSRDEFDRLFPLSSFPATYKDNGALINSSKELQEEAWKVYKDTSSGELPIAMGRLGEDIAKDGSIVIGTGTKAAKDKGFQILGSNTWSNKVNDA
ncbi:MAG: beta strand repeat-containing protein, partial [Psychrobium sp.]